MKAKTNQIFFNSKTPKYKFLTTFYPCTIKINGKKYKSVEHYYQSRKTSNSELKEWIISAPSASYAFRGGRSLKETDKIHDWKEKRIKFMKIALSAKFTQNRALKRRLLATGSADLQEDNQRDLLWGGYGKNMLGKLLMEVRQKLNENW